MARLTKAHLAAGNIVVLPTAATRFVNNNRCREQRLAAQAARAGNRFTPRYQPPWNREVDQLAADLANIEQTPELQILAAMLLAMDDATAADVMAKLGPVTPNTSTTRRQAAAFVKVSRLSAGGQMDLARAFSRLRGEVSR